MQANEGWRNDEESTHERMQNQNRGSVRERTKSEMAKGSRKKVRRRFLEVNRKGGGEVEEGRRSRKSKGEEEADQGKGENPKEAKTLIN